MKLPFFGRRSGETAQAAPTVAHIFVSRSAHDNEDPTVLVSQTVDFVNFLLGQGAYLRQEVPQNALRAYHTDYYLAQVLNGGHGQFVGNSRWQAETIADIEAGLQAMEADPYRAIFGDLRRLIDSDKTRAAAIAQGGGFGPKDPAIEDLDKRYFAHDAYKTLSPAIARWLRSLPELQVVEDTEYKTTVQALCEANPLRSIRLAARARQALEGRLLDPLHVTAWLLCMQAGSMPVVGLGGGDPAAIAPDGRQGTGWTIQSRAGRQVMFLFDDVAMLCDTYLADGRKLTSELLAEQRQLFSSGNLEALAAFRSTVQKEVARIPVSQIGGAFEAAKRFPVVEYAELLCSRLQPAETVKSVQAAMLHESGQFIWVLQGDRFGGFFCFLRDGGLGLFDPHMKPVLTVAKREVQAVQRTKG